MNENQIIENTLNFMQRVDLKGGEVPAFLESVTYLKNQLNKIGLNKENK